ncbi:aldehyde dehydrogenase family protein [Miniimonas arenae]|uniref:L-glutamate gamma-semialdehyde dehydrogenase n=1 Tax=Miniimonas arenae TaxID=676201 RepID=A0A5C5BE29_9MICO|nr:bifunctional proline dehydrogenase/L-glutamate gamma-semialdehyde dehydrogenase [Miniimonas arenae]TNU75792.1 aldehyde dehydrogenase family protein [Miniimonas arenae]
MTATPSLLAPDSLVTSALALAEEWQRASGDGASRAEQAASDRLGQLVANRAGLDLAVAFVDEVARPEDTTVAARALADLDAAAASAFLTPVDRAMFAVGQRVAPLAPSLVVPLARARLRQLVGHLVVDADRGLAGHMARARAAGYRLNVNLLGEAVLGEAEAASRVERTIALVRRPDVDYVSIKVSSLVSQISTWDTPGTVARVLERLRPLYRAALETGSFVNLDMEEYRDLDLTLEVFEAILAEPAFERLEAGIVLQAYLPDAPAAFERLVALATRRVAAGGTRIKVRLVKGANLAMERVESQLHGWPQAPHTSKAETDATYVRILDRALTPEVAGVLRLGVAGHNLYHLALAHLLATERGVAAAMDVEMLQGMAPAQARAVRDTVGSVLLYTPVIARADFDVAVSYLVRRLEENAAPENYLHQSVADGGQAEARTRFLASVRDAATVTTQPRRTSAPIEVAGVPTHATFENAADADPAVAWVRERTTAALAVAPDLTPRAPHLGSTGEVDDVVARARALAPAWGATDVARRAAVLADVAERIEAARFELIAVMAHEAGKTAGEADPEVSEAVDFARWYAGSALALAADPEDTAATEHDGAGARFVPVPVTLVTPPWNFPVAIAVGGVLAALAAGSAVVMKPSPSATRCGEVVAGLVREALTAAGFDADLVQVVAVDEDEVGAHLVAHDGVDQVVLTGSLETARLFASWRAGHPGGPRVFAETSGKNAIVVTPSADLDLAVADVVRSAFGHAGQKCSAASLVILVGSIGRSRRFHDQLVDAVRSLRVGVPDDLGTGMGPVVEVPSGKLLRGLTTLEPGERWVLAPRELTPPPGGERWAGRLWSPGVRAGVVPGSWFHRTECFGPVLGIMRADTLEEAIDWQNATAYGLTGGLHSLDPDEIALWRERVEVGNAYVNRHITGAVVQRQPFGGWKGSVMGPGAKAGGPHYVAQLGRWVEEGPVEPEAARAARQEADRALAAQWRTGADPSALACEENTLRLVPVPAVTVHVAPDAPAGSADRARDAADAAGVPTVVVTHGDGAALAADIAAGRTADRVRWVGPAGAPEEVWRAAIEAGVTVLDDPVLADGRRELLTMLREQAISRTRHRFGHVHA